jgi:hypothetical protein
VHGIIEILKKPDKKVGLKSTTIKRGVEKNHVEVYIQSQWSKFQSSFRRKPTKFNYKFYLND